MKIQHENLAQNQWSVSSASLPLEIWDTYGAICIFFFLFLNSMRQSLPFFIIYPNKNYRRPIGHLYTGIWACLKICLHAEAIDIRLSVRQTSNESSPPQVQLLADLQHNIAGPIVWSVAFQSFHQPCLVCFSLMTWPIRKKKLGFLSLRRVVFRHLGECTIFISIVNKNAII